MIINLQMKETSPTVIAGIMLKIENNSFFKQAVLRPDHRLLGHYMRLVA